MSDDTHPSPAAGGGAAAEKKAAARRGTITIRQVRSGICCNYRHKRTLKALGLRRMNQQVVHPDNPAIRGMVAAIQHLVRIVEA
ncbi:MAG: 50S ribosomal protein L30 [Thermoguttaceae bacterium]